MAQAKKPRPKELAKKAVRSPARRRQARKKSAPPTVATTAKHVELPLVVAPPTQVEPPTQIASPLIFWPALPIAMLRMWLGPRDTAAGK